MMIFVLGFVLFVAIAIAGFSHYRDFDPYIQNVLALEQNIQRGQEIFEINCAGCHGVYATGYVGPSLEHLSDRKSDTQIIGQVIDGMTPPMPKFQPEPQDMADLLAYLKRL
ncbi:MAG: cytochrome c [Cyanobacteria bacterium SBLK]|nr:cytochrome c [Cyanobacteria bacterium SBLK]